MNKLLVIFFILLASVANAQVPNNVNGPLRQLGTITSGHLTSWAGNNLVKDSGVTVGTGGIIAGSIALGTTTVTGGTNGSILYNNNGIAGNEAIVPPANGGSPTVNAASFSGTTWTAKVNAANSSSSCSSGCTIAVDDSLAGNGSATTVTLGNNTNLQFTGSGTFTSCLINAGEFSHFNLGAATITLSGTNCIGISQTNNASEQVEQRYMVQGGTINCNGQTAATGLYVGNHADTTMQDTVIFGCNDSTSTLGSPTGGLVLNGTQFGQFYNIKMYNNYVGLKLYNTSVGGGGNSNSFYDLNITGIANSLSPVCVLLQSVGSTFVQAPNYFYNLTTQSCSVAGTAIMNANATFPSSTYIYGGAPEVDGGGASTVTIDGVTISQASFYVQKGQLFVENMYVAEATINPIFYGVSGSTFFLRNVGGTAGNQQFTKTDSTSTTVLDGYNNFGASTVSNLILDQYNGFTTFNQTLGLESYTSAVTNSPILGLYGSIEIGTSGPTYAKSGFTIQTQETGGLDGASGLQYAYVGASTSATIGLNGAGITEVALPGSNVYCNISQCNFNTIISNTNAFLTNVNSANLTATGNVSAAAFIPTGTAVPTNGTYLSAANALGFSTNSTQAMVITSGRNVGIGTATPANLLHVNGIGQFGTANTTLGTLVLEGNTSGALTIIPQATAGTPTWTAGTSSGTPVVTASSPLVITAATGNITCTTCLTGTAGSGARAWLSFQPGLMTAVSNAKAGFHQVSAASTVDNLIVSAQQFSCTGNPTITMYECGTSTTCATPTAIGTATPTAAATAFPGTITSSAITAGDYVAFAVSSGTCVTLDIAATAQIHAN